MAGDEELIEIVEQHIMKLMDAFARGDWAEHKRLIENPPDGMETGGFGELSPAREPG